MERCPQCKNKGWKPSEEFKLVLRNIKKIKHRNFAIRYYVCLNCGYRFKTKEDFFEEVNSPDLFDERETVGS